MTYKPMRNSIYTRCGKLSAYGFACGYKEVKSYVSIYRENGVYHVVCSEPRWVHTSYRTLKEARAKVRELTKSISKERQTC